MSDLRSKSVGIIKNYLDINHITFKSKNKKLNETKLSRQIYKIREKKKYFFSKYLVIILTKIECILVMIYFGL